MARIFWVACPKCGGKFYAHYDDFRHKDIDLLCPFCSVNFDQKDSPFIDDRQ